MLGRDLVGSGRPDTDGYRPSRNRQRYLLTNHGSESFCRRRTASIFFSSSIVFMLPRTFGYSPPFGSIASALPFHRNNYGRAGYTAHLYIWRIDLTRDLEHSCALGVRAARTALRIPFTTFCATSGFSLTILVETAQRFRGKGRSSPSTSPGVAHLSVFDAQPLADRQQRHINLTGHHRARASRRAARSESSRRYHPGNVLVSHWAA